MEGGVRTIDWDTDEWKEEFKPLSRGECWSSESDGIDGSYAKLEDIFSFERDISMPLQRLESDGVRW